MNILITGGTGYLGSRISLDLSRHNKIFIQSRKKKKSNLNFKNINQFQYDWKDHSILNKYLKTIDVIIHAAGVNSNFCETRKKEAQECYLSNTEILYYYASKNNICKIINFSTTHVYGDQNGQLNEDNDIDLYNDYAFLNYERENLSKKYDKNNIQFINLRLSNCIGYPVFKQTNCWELVIPNICKNIILKNDIGLKTQIDFYKNFSTIYDLCKLIRLIIYSKKKLPSLINFSSGKPKKISQMIRIIIKNQNKFYNKKFLNNLNKLKYVNKPNQNITSIYLDKIKFKFSNNYSYEIKKLINVTNNFFLKKNL